MTAAPHHRDTEHPSDDELRLSVADHRLRKTRVLARQCSTCVFAPGNRMHLAPGQLSDMVKQARRTGSYIICHDTLPYGPYPHIPPAICRGFYDRYDTQALQLARRLWGFVEVEPPDQPAAINQNHPGSPGVAPHPQEGNDMNRCPKCGATGQLTLTRVFAAKPAGSYSLAGAQDKTTAVDAARLSCAGCGWWATGRVDGLRVAEDGTITGGHLVTDQPPPTATSPARHPAGQAPTLPREEPRPRRYWSAALGRHVTVPDDEDDPR